MEFICEQPGGGSFHVIVIEDSSEEAGKLCVSLKTLLPEDTKENYEEHFINEMLKLPVDVYPKVFTPDLPIDMDIVVFLNKQCNIIAKKTKRGPGTIMLVNQKVIDNIDSETKLRIKDSILLETISNELVSDDKIIVICKLSELDGPFYVNKDNNSYVMHPNWKDYVRVVKLED